MNRLFRIPRPDLPTDLAADLPVALQDGTQNAEGATLHFGPFQLATLRITR